MRPGAPGAPTRIGALTIGAAPRPDLVACLRLGGGSRPGGSRPGGIHVVQAGALDDVARPDQLPAPVGDSLPLETRSADGRRVVVDERTLLPRLQLALDRLEASDVALTVLLCAGGFAALRSRRPLIRPFDATVTSLRAWHVQRMVVVVPFAAQAGPASAKWRAVGFEPARTLAGHDLGEIAPRLLASLADAPSVDAIVLDYVGHAPADVAALRRTLEAAHAPRLVDLAEEAGVTALATLAALEGRVPAERSEVPA